MIARSPDLTPCVSVDKCPMGMIARAYGTENMTVIVETGEKVLHMTRAAFET